MNTARKTHPRIIDISNTNEENDKRQWHYIDLDEFEFRIRQEELEKHIAERRAERKMRRWNREARIDLFKLTLIPRMCGIFGLMLSVFAALMLQKLGETDMTFLMITVPLSLFAIIMPGWNKPTK